MVCIGKYSNVLTHHKPVYFHNKNIILAGT